MTVADSTNVAYIMKRRYSDAQSTEVARREHPTFYEIMDTGSFDGSDFAYATTTGNPQGISSGTLANAQTAAETIKGEQFLATPRVKYGICQLDGVSMMKARGNKGSFYDFATRHIDGTLDEMGANLAFDLFRNGVGQRGKIAVIAGNVLTLTNLRDVENFRRGMTIIASVNADGSAAKAGACKVTKLNRSAKQITVDNLALITGTAAVNDFLFRLGDPGNCMEGMGVATPLVAPTVGVLFRNVERTNDLEALAGSRIDDTSRYPEEILGDLAVEISLIGKKVSRGVVYPTVFQSMVKRLGAKVMYTSPGGAADIGFESIMIHTAGGALKIVSDPDQDPTLVRVWRPDAHQIKHIDELVHIIRDDNNKSIRLATADGIELRFRSVSNYLQPDQASHGVGTFAN
jgi:hypothetical protein